MTQNAKRRTQNEPVSIERTAFRVQPSEIGAEALDDPSADPLLVARMLREIATANWWFGGRGAVAVGLRALFEPGDRGRELSLLDIGTGAGDLPHWAQGWTARRGIALRTLGLERLPAAAALAHHAGLPVLLGCASALPVRDAGVDIVLLSQLAHHFDDVSILHLFGEASRIARRGVVVAELRPSRMAGLAYRLAGGVLGFHRTTIDDGVTSLARGFDPARLRTLALDQGTDLRVQTGPFARVTASWRTQS